MTRLLILSRYDRLGASSRIRFYQYLPYLCSNGYDVTIAPLFGNDYIQGLYSGSIPMASVAKSYLRRLKTILRAREYDIAWIEGELLPWVPASLELLAASESIPNIIDYDDAIFHRYDDHPSAVVRFLLGGKVARLVRRAALVVTGNQYLAGWARQAGAVNVEVLPSVVDVERFRPKTAVQSGGTTIGWIGSPATVRYLRPIAFVMGTIAGLPGARVVAIGASPKQLDGLPFEAQPWSEDTEVCSIQQFDIGIMPLSDLPWDRGKCGYKLIQYMACGIPVVASPVGVNQEIVEHGQNGYLATTQDQWLEAIKKLMKDPELRRAMGEAARKKVVREYALQITAPRLTRLLADVADRRKRCAE